MAAVTLAPPNLQNSGDNAALATGTNRPTTVANLHPDNVYLLDQLLVHSSLQDTNGVGMLGSDPLAPCPVDCPQCMPKGNRENLERLLQIQQSVDKLAGTSAQLKQTTESPSWLILMLSWPGWRSSAKMCVTR